MSESSDATCAVWYWRYYQLDYELCADENEAARFAVSLEDNEQGSVSGVQFADGRIIERDAWNAYEAEDKRRSAEWAKRAAEAAANPPPPKPMRKAVDPFGSKPIEIPLDAPAWLGS